MHIRIAFRAFSVNITYSVLSHNKLRVTSREGGGRLPVYLILTRLVALFVI